MFGKVVAALAASSWAEAQATLRTAQREIREIFME
jgi:hypothetical protein